ncbi:MAG: hypothetical protein PHX93_04830 [Candidatus Peribacteraceae bacterium]|jgi:mRNA-degrading endonuclease YafQ of YafQ-DinJ toxin-antitoxin module|nr:hypothetical protein [Candidatus Peribacteraceae bacterium]
MIVRFLPSFKRAYRKLSEGQRHDVDGALQIFVRAPFDPCLHNHQLKGGKKGVYAITAGYDLRILFAKSGNAITLLLTVGTHNEVY